MSDSRPICHKCQRAMTCEKNDDPVACGNGYIKLGDRFRCTRCDVAVVVGFGKMFRSNRYADAARDTASDEREAQFEELEL